jgi:hypothetical protein
MILHPLRILPKCSLAKPSIQIRTSAEYTSSACDYNALYALVDVKHGVCGLDLLAHCVGKRIMVFGSIQRENNNRRLFLMMARLDLREFEVVVGGGEVDVGFMAGRLVAAWRHGY